MSACIFIIRTPLWIACSQLKYLALLVCYINSSLPDSPALSFFLYINSLYIRGTIISILVMERSIPTVVPDLTALLQQFGSIGALKKALENLKSPAQDATSRVGRSVLTSTRSETTELINIVSVSGNSATGNSSVAATEPIMTLPQNQKNSPLSSNVLSGK